MTKYLRPVVLLTLFSAFLATVAAQANTTTPAPGSTTAPSSTSSGRPSLPTLPPINDSLPHIVLVHGAIADGSSWTYVLPILHAKGYNVTAVQQPLSSIPDDVAKVQAVLNGLQGPIVLVGHSFGGVVITQAGHNNTKVGALVYVAAFAPDLNETVTSIAQANNFTALPSASFFTPDSMGRVVLPQDKFLQYFAPDVQPVAQARLMAAAQGPSDTGRFTWQSGPPAWKEHPSYYVVAGNDQIIDPKMETFFAKRMNATKTIVIPGSSHAVLVSHNVQVASLILEAAAAVAKK